MKIEIMERRGILAQFVLRIQLCAAFSVGFLATADPVIFRPKSNRAIFDAKLFSSEDNFDSVDGTFEKLGPNKYFNVNTYRLEWNYVATSRKAYKLGLTASQGESSDGVSLRKNSVLTNAFLGMQYFLLTNPMKIKPELMVFYSNTPIDPNGDDIILSEGVLEVKFGTWLQKKALSLDNYIYLGADYRADGRASLAEYAIGTKIDFDGLALGGEAFGYQSITDDELTNTPSQRTAVTSRVNGGSLKYYSINPNLLSAKAYVEAQISEALALKGEYTFDLQGKNSAKGDTIGVLVVWDFNSVQGEFTKTRRKEVNNDDLKKFNIESTEYNERLFQEDSPKPFRRKKEKTDEEILNEAEKHLDKKFKK